MPGKQVSQATFDAIVREAMSDFGLSAPDALAEARTQLAAVGVADLSNIVTSVPAESAADHPVVRLLADLDLAVTATAPAASAAAATANDDTDADRARAPPASAALRAALAALDRAARESPETRGVAGARGALQTVADALETCPAEAAGALEALCANCEVNRTTFVALPRGMHALCAALVRFDPGHGQTEEDAEAAPNVHQAQVTYSDTASSHHRRPIATLIAVLRSVHVVLDRNENAKSTFLADPRALHAVLRSLRRYSGCAAPAVVRACCAVLRALLASDDDTKLVSETFNRARLLCAAQSVVHSGLPPLPEDIEALPITLFRILSGEAGRSYTPDGAVETANKQNMESTAVLVECLALARMCAVSDEICESLIELGYPDLVLKLLAPANGRVNLGLARTGVAILRNIGARDDAKAVLSARMSEISAVMVAHADDAQLCERYCGLVGVLCLRRPDLAVQLGEAHGAVDAVLNAMRTHADNRGVQRNGCIALRNLVVRTESQKKRVREDGTAEKLLRTAMKKFPSDCDDIAYNALYDLDVLEDREMRRDRRYTTPF